MELKKEKQVRYVVVFTFLDCVFCVFFTTSFSVWLLRIRNTSVFWVMIRSDLGEQLVLDRAQWKNKDSCSWFQ